MPSVLVGPTVRLTEYHPTDYRKNTRIRGTEYALGCVSMGDCAASDLHLVTFGHFRSVDARLPLIHWHTVFERLAWLTFTIRWFIQRSVNLCMVQYPSDHQIRDKSDHFFLSSIGDGRAIQETYWRIMSCHLKD